MCKKIALVCMLFAAVSTSQATQFLDKVVAVVNNGVITSSELDKQVSLTKKQLLAQRMQLPPDNVLRKQVLQHLIDVDLQMQMAKQNGITVDDTELNQAIERIASANHATMVQLREEITRQGMGWNEYRESIRKEMILSNLQQKAVGREVRITNEQVEQFLKTEGDLPVDRTNLTYHLQNIIIPLSESPSASEVQKAQKIAERVFASIRKGADFSHLPLDSAMSSFFLDGSDLGERHLGELPELFAKEVINMKVGQVVGPLRAGNGLQLIKLVSIGGAAKQQHVVTLTHARHILLKTDASMLPEDAKKQVNNIYQQLIAGKDFATMAKQYSLDTGSAVKGGDLGWISPGETVPEFEKAMNKLPLNQVSKPVKSQFGWHLIEVLGRKQQDDSVAFKKQQVRQFLHQRKFAEAVHNWQQHIRRDAYINVVEKDLA
ncbi:peptidylprolyl isomerase [Legionella lytica]|uniref:Chaperone SurA n=1 Tax=Legionella lytica TaxID=96232 RepID=A0ABY4YA90_9GAMM|nr:peptidylprolyl isomerase [Legionella lytica]USQ14009.1 peptidylprolyl isomerase [Legionella lytica]